MSSNKKATIDDALELLKDFGPEYNNGLSNHGPMLADALFSLDRASTVLPWLEQYKKHLIPSSNNTTEPISRTDYQSALGCFERYPDWQVFFRALVKEDDWKLVLNYWVSILSPGYIAAAMHGVIRVGHAVRSLSSVDSDNTRNELADGLSYWAARYQSLPEVASGKHNSGGSIDYALSTITRLPDSQRKNLGLISEEVVAVGAMTTFPEVINLFESSKEPDKVLSNLTEGFARVFVDNAEETKRVIEFVHSVTGPYALRHMLPYLEKSVAKKALRYAWQASAALYVRYGIKFSAKGVQDVPTLLQSELVERAVATRDEHAVKFVEACIFEHRLKADPVYLDAAAICAKLLRD
ncbi:MAG TPA: questin oxidase family protein [Oculatellaceae cyanobacterium]